MSGGVKWWVNTIVGSEVVDKLFEMWITYKQHFVTRFPKSMSKGGEDFVQKYDRQLQSQY